MVAKMIVRPSQVEVRLDDNRWVGGSLAPETLSHIMTRIIEERIETVEIHYENVDD